MSGCELPVSIISGSGNQGITASVPVVIYARDMGASEEELLRALIVADLITIHQKTGIGTLSAYCGAISAGVGAGIMSFEMWRLGRQFYGGDGIVTKGVENTIRNIGRLARDGMSEADKEIIKIMLGKN